MIINFKEIPLANTGLGNQDTFELFARDFLETLGYEIIKNPTRGADNGKDLIVKEIRKGVSEQISEIMWLVSCKHNAHSGKSVTPTLEQNIYDRVKANNCEGFIGFYSTLPSENLIFNLNNIPFQIFDSKKIEKYIVGYSKYTMIFIRYFPDSYKKWKEINFTYEPIKLFDFFINYKYPNGLSLFKSIFDSNENIYTALKNSNSFYDFIKFKNIKIYKINIDLELDILYNKFEEELANKSFSEREKFIERKFLKEILRKEKLEYFDSKKISGRRYYENGIGTYILESNFLIINELELEKIISEYRDLKKIITS